MYSFTVGERARGPSWVFPRSFFTGTGPEGGAAGGTSFLTLNEPPRILAPASLSAATQLSLLLSLLQKKWILESQESLDVPSSVLRMNIVACFSLVLITVSLNLNMPISRVKSFPAKIDMMPFSFTTHRTCIPDVELGLSRSSRCPRISCCLVASWSAVWRLGSDLKGALSCARSAAFRSCIFMSTLFLGEVAGDSFELPISAILLLLLGYAAWWLSPPAISGRHERSSSIASLEGLSGTAFRKGRYLRGEVLGDLYPRNVF
mmetsp:Transcript_21415/g.70951  ORF Transcript_21415/g.70951 Transcript_21415/m.70951 type:complete len:262 (+) Transcript_21415:79-864(+)